MKTANLQDAALDYWVARAEGHTAIILFDECVVRHGEYHDEMQYGKYAPSTDWAIGGPLIEKYDIEVMKHGRRWRGDGPEFVEFGDTPLQAICRAVVRAAFGDEVEEVLL